MNTLHATAKFKLHKNIITRFTKPAAAPAFGLTTIFTSSVADFGRKA